MKQDNKEVIITGYSNISERGVTLHTNIPAKLKTGNVFGKTMWVSWDKIGKSLIDNYTTASELDDMNNLRKSEEA